MKMLIIAVVVLIGLGVACGEVDKAQIEQSRLTRILSAEAQAQAGMPKLANFTELKMLNFLYELRDQEGLVTYTYAVDLQGRLWHICDSIGFGVPYSAQRSSPNAPIGTDPGTGWNKGVWVLPQPEPNGLFPPTSSSATWVICADPEGSPVPMYVETLISVSTFPLEGAVGSWTKKSETKKSEE